MRRWLFLSGLSTVLLSAIVSLMVYIGRQQPLPERLRLLHLDICEPPCWIGIVPGKTTGHEATAQIQEFFKDFEFFPDGAGGALYFRKNFDQGTYSYSITVESENPNRIVNSIKLDFNGSTFNALPTLGEVLYRYGAPSHIVLFGNYYLIMKLNEQSRDPIYEIRGEYLDQVSPTDMVYSITFSKPIFDDVDVNTLDGLILKWQGFKTKYPNQFQP
jgi:hypothetical protein